MMIAVICVSFISGCYFHYVFSKTRERSVEEIYKTRRIAERRAQMILGTSKE